MAMTAEEGPAYMPLPSSMAQYTPPLLPDDAAVLEAGKPWLERIEAALRAYQPGTSHSKLDLAGASPAALQFLKEVLGSGEVSALAIGYPDVQAEESIFAGLWRVRGGSRDDGDFIDYLEVADIPDILRARAAAEPLALPDPAAIPGDVVNAPHILAEILARAKNFAAAGETHNFNLDLVPMSDADLGWLVATLGEGPVVIVSAGYGACRIRSTRAHAVWWVQFSNAADALILNSVDIAGIPAVACAAPDDIADSAKRVSALRGVYR